MTRHHFAIALIGSAVGVGCGGGKGGGDGLARLTVTLDADCSAIEECAEVDVYYNGDRLYEGLAAGESFEAEVQPGPAVIAASSEAGCSFNSAGIPDEIPESEFRKTFRCGTDRPRLTVVLDSGCAGVCENVSIYLETTRLGSIDAAGGSFAAEVDPGTYTLKAVALGECVWEREITVDARGLEQRLTCEGIGD